MNSFISGYIYLRYDRKKPRRGIYLIFLLLLLLLLLLCSSSLEALGDLQSA